MKIAYKSQFLSKEFHKTVFVLSVIIQNNHQRVTGSIPTKDEINFPRKKEKNPGGGIDKGKTAQKIAREVRVGVS